METIFLYIQYGAPWLLVLMGAFVSIRPPRPGNRRGTSIWIIAFGTIATLLTVAQIFADGRDYAERYAHRQELTGGDNFAYLRVRDAVSSDGGNFAEITTTGTLPNLYLGFYPVLPDGTVVDQKQQWPPAYSRLPRTTFNSRISITPGRWQVHFLMGEKKWIEHLEFERTPKGVAQTIWVERDGEVIYREPREKVVP